MWIRILIALLIPLAINAVLIASTESIDYPDIVGFIFAGFVSAQFALLAMYFLGGKAPRIQRCAIAFFVLVLIWYSLAWGAWYTGDSFAVSSIERLMAIASVLTFLINVLLYGVIYFGWRWIRGFQKSDRSLSHVRSQVNLKQIGILVAWSAIVLMLLRSEAGKEILDPWSMNVGDLVSISMGLSIASAICLIIAISIMIGILSRADLPMLFIVTFLWTLLASVAEHEVIGWFSDNDRRALLWCYNVTVFAQVWIGFGAMYQQQVISPHSSVKKTERT